ncbi:hypothetical protein EON82_03180 [bacterium]|nr:MAG: hypothetical protein EON82_03180 [bacterium]
MRNSGMCLLRATLPCIALLSLGALFGCGGHGGGKGSSGSTNSFKLMPGVVELDKTATQVVSVSGNTVVLTDAPAISAGQVLIHNALDDKRFARKVVTATTEGATTTVTTTDAGLEDVIQTANIDERSEFDAATLVEKLQPAQDGVEFSVGSTRSKTRAASRAPGEGLTITFTKMELKDDANNAIVEVDGSVTLNAGIEKVLKKSLLSIDEFVVAPFADVSGTLKARGRVAGSFTKEFPISLNARIPVTPLGPLGVNCDVQLTMKVEGSYSAEGQFVVTARVFAKEGIRYTKSGGWGLINEFTKSFDFQPPSFRGSVEMGASLVRPKIGADILTIGEAHVTADVVKLIGRISAQSAPVPGFLVEGFGDFGFTAGGSLRLGPITLWNEEKSFDLARFQVVKPILLRTLSATDTSIAYASLDLRSLHLMNGDGSNDRTAITSSTAIFSPNVSNRGGLLCYGKFNSAGRGEIWTADANGGNQRRLTDGTLSINHCIWSPGGDEIAFDASDANNVKQVYVVKVSSGAIRQMTSGSTASRIPCWSADGRTIYFEAATSFGTRFIARTSSASQTYDIVLADDTTSYAEPSMSPNGLQLVCLKGGSDIVVSDERGRGERLVRRDSHLSRPTWSPDGTRILVQYNDIGTTRVLSFDLQGEDVKDCAAGLQPSWGLRN